MGTEQLTFTKNNIINIEVAHLGAISHLEIAQNQKQLEEAKALDDLAFGSHQGITMEELIEIKNHGAVILLRDTQGNLIGESQVITSPIPQHNNLEPDEAFNYGTAVLPCLQNQGIAQILFKAQEVVALEAGKTRSTLTARLENAKSLRARFKAGFQIVGYDPNYYGTFENDGARLIMERDLVHIKEIIPAANLIQKVTSGEALPVNQDNIDSILQSEQPLIYFRVKSGDGIDYNAHNLIGKIFNTNIHIGIGLLKPSELNAKENQYCLLLLKHK